MMNESKLLEGSFGKVMALPLASVPHIDQGDEGRQVDRRIDRHRAGDRPQPKVGYTLTVWSVSEQRFPAHLNGLQIAGMFYKVPLGSF